MDNGVLEKGINDYSKFFTEMIGRNKYAMYWSEEDCK